MHGDRSSTSGYWSDNHYRWSVCNDYVPKGRTPLKVQRACFLKYIVCCHGRSFTAHNVLYRFCVWSLDQQQLINLHMHNVLYRSSTARLVLGSTPINKFTYASILGGGGQQAHCRTRSVENYLQFRPHAHVFCISNKRFDSTVFICCCFVMFVVVVFSMLPFA